MGATKTKSEMLDVAADADDVIGSRWPGMTYEQGVAAALRWAAGEEPLSPLDEE